MYYEITQGIEVQVVPEYVPSESNALESQFLFSYHITITNKGDTDVQLMSRHWIITDGAGTIREVKGAGVIGEQPKLRPGEKFEYSSFCPLRTPTGNMRGTFQMVNHLGAQFDIKVPLFFLRDTRSLH